LIHFYTFSLLLLSLITITLSPLLPLLLMPWYFHITPLFITPLLHYAIINTLFFIDYTPTFSLPLSYFPILFFSLLPHGISPLHYYCHWYAITRHITDITPLRFSNIIFAITLFIRHYFCHWLFLRHYIAFIVILLLLIFFAISFISLLRHIFSIISSFSPLLILLLYFHCHTWYFLSDYTHTYCHYILAITPLLLAMISHYFFSLSLPAFDHYYFYCTHWCHITISLYAIDNTLRPLQMLDYYFIAITYYIIIDGHYAIISAMILNITLYYYADVSLPLALRYYIIDSIYIITPLICHALYFLIFYYAYWPCH